MSNKENLKLEEPKNNEVSWRSQTADEILADLKEIIASVISSADGGETPDAMPPRAIPHEKAFKKKRSKIMSIIKGVFNVKQRD